MIACPAKPAPFRVAARVDRWLTRLAFGLVAGAAHAAAQEPAEPLPLIPRSADPVVVAPTGPDSVSIGEIEEASGDAAGALGPGNGGFGADLWRGAEPNRLLDLMRRLPVAARSPAMRDMMRRLLASAAAPAPGVLPEGVFVTQRLALLVKLGAFEEAILTADSAGDPPGLWPRAEAFFWRGEVERACVSVRTAIAAAPTRQWRRALVLCQVHDGNVNAAGLTLALLNDQADGTDDTYLRLAGHLLGYAAVETPLLDDGLGFAASVVGRVPIKPGDVAELGPAALRAIALHPDVVVETRLAAAERAAATGALSSQELGDICRLPSFTAEELDAVTSTTKAADGAIARALLFQAALAAVEGDRRAALLSALWSPAPDGPGFAPLARASAEALFTLAPNRRLAWFAPDAVRALAANDRGAAATAWRRTLAIPATADTEAAAARWRGFPLVAALNAGADWNADTATRWWNETPPEIDSTTRARRADRVFMILDALGRNIGAEGWTVFLDSAPEITVAIPNIGLRYGMRDAARARRTGEALLLALIVLGDAGPAAASSLTLGAVIRTLRALGLADDARAIAIEALIEDSR